jgi:hypothetical protein
MGVHGTEVELEQEDICRPVVRRVGRTSKNEVAVNIQRLGDRSKRQAQVWACPEVSKTT